IHRCPKVRNLDGAARPVMMDSLDTGVEANTDGICLDGMRLFEDPPGSRQYRAEKQSASAERQDARQITRTADGSFQIVTKAGETRLYGSTAAGRVMVGNAAGTGSEAAVWALDRVSDIWGNYYEVVY